VIVVLVFVAAVVAVTAAVCGHQGQPFPPACWWRTVRVALGSRKALKAPLAPSEPESDQIPDLPAERRSGSQPHRTPTWAHSQPLDYQEAA
jgi:hypothetical protein